MKKLIAIIIAFICISCVPRTYKGEVIGLAHIPQRIERGLPTMWNSRNRIVSANYVAYLKTSNRIMKISITKECYDTLYIGKHYLYDSNHNKWIRKE